MDKIQYKANILIDPKIEAKSSEIIPVKNASPFHWHDFYEFFLVTKGKCNHIVNDSFQQLEKGFMVFIRPEDSHSYSYDTMEEGCFLNINFTKEIVHDAFRYYGDHILEKNLLSAQLPPCKLLTAEEQEEYIYKAENLRKLETIDKLQARLQARSLLIELLAFFFEDYHSDEVVKMPMWFDSVLAQMQRKENFTMGLHELYRISGKSVGHLNRVFKQYLNTTPTAYLNNVKLNYARTLLLTTNLSILDISLEAGFENLSHFYHLFKKEFGTAPGNMRDC